jgi:hypothetical protein
MIDLNQFSPGFKKVNHSLENFWNWDNIRIRIEQNTSESFNYYRDLGNGGFTLGGMEKDSYCKKVLDYLHPYKPKHYPRAGMYVSTRADSKSFPKHNDPGQYLWIWQIIGNTKWIVEESEILLECGEILYISPGLFHQALPDSPRASITFSLEEYE